mmetsp:Transcript_91867/g.295310  ORF Transcript_91867/g.295310 Transcript_91867/m.295310 type:complete len:453 (-) Transcript_91867:924-2282(-)
MWASEIPMWVERLKRAVSDGPCRCILRARATRQEGTVPRLGQLDVAPSLAADTVEDAAPEGEQSIRDSGAGHHGPPSHGAHWTRRRGRSPDFLGRLLAHREQQSHRGLEAPDGLSRGVDREDWPRAGAVPEVVHALQVVKVLGHHVARVVKKGAQDEAAEGVLFFIRRHEFTPRPHRRVAPRLHALRQLAASRPPGDLAAQRAPPHAEVRAHPAQAPLLLVREQVPWRSLPASERCLGDGERRLGRQHALGRLQLLVEAAPARPLLRRPLLGLRGVSAVPEDVQEEHRPEVPRQRGLAARRRHSQRELEPQGLQQKHGRGGRVDRVRVDDTMLRALRAVHRHGRQEGGERSDCLHGKDASPRETRNVQNSHGHRCALKDDDQSIASAGRAILHQGVHNAVIAQALKDLVHTQGHANSAIGVVALPLRLQLPKELDVPLGLRTTQALEQVLAA